MLEAMRGADGEIVIDDTGDPLIDKWEREMAMGLDPDLEEGLSDTEKEKLKKERAKSKGVRDTANDALINEDFTKTAEQDDKMFDSKMVPVGSPEDRALLRAAALGRTAGRSPANPAMLGGAMNRRGR